MAEKVVSLSGGLLLGTALALILGFGATQSILPNSSFEIPSVLKMTIAQNPQSPSASTSDTATVGTVATPASSDQGRITRIATLVITADPILQSNSTSTTASTEPKDWKLEDSPKIDNSLYRTNLQRSYLATNPQSESYSDLDMVVARQVNFTAICESAGEEYIAGSLPAEFSDKPQTHGSPPVAQNNPGASEGPGANDPALTSENPKPEPGYITNGNNSDNSDNRDNGNTREQLNSGRTRNSSSLNQRVSAVNNSSNPNPHISHGCRQPLQN